MVDVVTVHVPVIGTIFKEFQMARMARTLSSLLGAGVEFVVALEVTATVIQNHLYKNILEEAHLEIQKGESLSSIFGRYPNLYPAFVEEMTAVGEETGKIDEILIKVADFYEEEVDTVIDSLASIIEPLMIVLLGGIIGIIAASVMGPIAGLSKNIGS